MDEKVFEISSKSVTMEVKDDRTGGFSGGSCRWTTMKTPIFFACGAKIWTEACRSWYFSPPGAWSAAGI